MESKDNNAANVAPHWAGPWAAGWTGMQSHLATGAQRRPASWIADNGRPRLHTLPPNARRRLQRIGVAASSLAASVWLLGGVWVLQNIR